VTTVVDTLCGMVTTERAKSTILNAKAIAGARLSGGERTGIPTNCNSLAAGDAEGATQVGHRVFIDGRATGDQESASHSVTIPKP
jgi:hypothetical protein